MLTLTRRVHERILIGDDIAITVVSIAGGQVKLGITAPKDVRIVREEILETQEKVTIAKLLREEPT